MSTLSSTSTWTQVKAAYDDNASYEEDGSAAKARAFITACRIIIRRLSSRAKKGEEEVEFDIAMVRKELEDARNYVAAVDPTVNSGGVVHASFQEFAR